MVDPVQLPWPSLSEPGGPYMSLQCVVFAPALPKDDLWLVEGCTSTRKESRCLWAVTARLVQTEACTMAQCSVGSDVICTHDLWL